MNKLSIVAFTIIAAVTVSILGNSAPSSADDYDIVLNSIYEQMVTEKKNSAYVETDINIDTDKLIDRIEQADKEDTLYDGVSLVYRGSDFSIKKYTSKATGKVKGYEACYKAGTDYGIDEADSMTDKIAKELLEKAGKNSTDREKAYTLFTYMGDNFYYDYDQLEKREPFTKIINEGRNGFICIDYAMMTYLIANKMGIPCELILGTDHIYNTMKIDGQWLYCDLSGAKYGFIDSETYSTAECYKVDKSTAAGRSAIAGNAEKTGSTVSAFELVRQTMYYITHGERIGDNIVTERMLNIGIAGIAAIIILIMILTAIIRHIKAVRKAHRGTRK